MESKIKESDIIENFNQNYNKLKLYIEKIYGNKTSLLQLFKTIEFYSGISMEDNFNVSIDDPVLINKIIPDLLGVDNIKILIKNNDINVFESLPIQKFESNTILFGNQSLTSWRNIKNNKESSNAVLKTILQYFQFFLNLHDIYHKIIDKKQ